MEQSLVKDPGDSLDLKDQLRQNKEVRLVQREELALATHQDHW